MSASRALLYAEKEERNSASAEMSNADCFNDSFDEFLMDIPDSALQAPCKEISDAENLFSDGDDEIFLNAVVLAAEMQGANQKKPLFSSNGTTSAGAGNETEFRVRGYNVTGSSTSSVGCQCKSNICMICEGDLSCHLTLEGACDGTGGSCTGNSMRIWQDICACCLQGVKLKLQILDANVVVSVMQDTSRERVGRTKGARPKRKA